MNEQAKTHPELIEEISVLKRKLKELEQAESERNQAGEGMLQREERFRRAINASEVGLWEWDIRTNQEFFAPRWCEIIGYSFDDPEFPHTYNSWSSRIHPDDYDRVVSALNAHLEKGTKYDVDYRHRHKSGEYHWQNSKGQAFFDESGKPIKMVGCISDITARKLSEEALRDSENRYRELSIVDDLTQLYNSRYFYFQLKIELDRSNRYELPLTLLLLDLDNFKKLNDTYGHVEGDQVLKRFGQVITKCLRETDFAFRYGGEEFAILLPMTTGTDAAVTAERISAKIKDEVFSPALGNDVHVTVSIGLGQYKPQEDMKTFVHRVDQLMYQAKKTGKDRVCCES